ncbi:MAG: aminopeptidase [Candidatus Bathyarchaeota archaeon]|nr:aminopeptidase [Candidatus Bathyarchaeum tardum]
MAEQVRGGSRLESWVAARNALQNVLEACEGERILVICDEEKTDIGQAFAKGALSLGLWTRFLVLEKQSEIRTEIPEYLQLALSQKPEIFVNILTGNREETPFRIKIIKTEIADRQSRLGHCPGVTLDMLTDGALALSAVEHEQLQNHADKLMKALEGAVSVKVCSKSGTDLTLGVEGRSFFTDTKLDWELMKWMNLPTGEVIVAPVENRMNGKLFCDLAVGGIGKLRHPVEINIKDGKVESVFCEDPEHLRRIKQTFSTDQWANVVGEFAFGINPKAKFVNEFLEAEKMLGTIHVAFGANTDMPGGKNLSQNHMDLMVSEPTVTITKKNGKTVAVLQKGVFLVT